MPRPTHNLFPQFSLGTFFEITSGFALLIAALRLQNLFLNWLVFAFFMVWVVRVRDLPLRWSLMACFGGCAAIFFGFMCLRIAFSGPPEQRSSLEYLAFLGPLISGCGGGLALIGATLTFRCLLGFRVKPDREYWDG